MRDVMKEYLLQDDDTEDEEVDMNAPISFPAFHEQPTSHWLIHEF